MFNVAQYVLTVAFRLLHSVYTFTKFCKRFTLMDQQFPYLVTKKVKEHVHIIEAKITCLLVIRMGLLLPGIIVFTGNNSVYESP